MVKQYFKFKFPCGYEVEVAINSWTQYYKIHWNSGCPLHGKDCGRRRK